MQAQRQQLLPLQQPPQHLSQQPLPPPLQVRFVFSCGLWNMHRACHLHAERISLYSGLTTKRTFRSLFLGTLALDGHTNCDAVSAQHPESLLWKLNPAELYVVLFVTYIAVGADMLRCAVQPPVLPECSHHQPRTLSPASSAFPTLESGSCWPTEEQRWIVQRPPSQGDCTGSIWGSYTEPLSSRSDRHAEYGSFRSAYVLKSRSL